MVEITTMGLDIAKQIFQVHGVSSDGRTQVKRQLRRSEVLLCFGVQF
jgi:transposase